VSSEMILIPCRGVNCKHLDCFDLMTFLSFYMKTATDMKWKCFHCKNVIPWKNIRIDIYLHKIIKRIMTEHPSKEVSTICFDDQGNWHLQDEFSEEWNKANQKTKKKKPKDNEEVKEEKKKEAPPVSNIIKKTELPIEECLEVYNHLIEQFKYMTETNRIFENVAIKMKEYNSFKNFSAKKMYEFLEKAQLLATLAIPSIFSSFEGRSTPPEAKIEEEVDRLMREKLEIHVKVIFAWAQKPEDLLNITLYLISKNKTSDPDFGLALELLLCYSRYMENNKIPFIFQKTNMQHIFGNLLRLFGERLGWKTDEFGYMIYSFRKCLPTMLLPDHIDKHFSIENQTMFNRLAEFFVELCKDFTMEEFIVFLDKTYKPPKNKFSFPEEETFAKYFVWYFGSIMKLRDPNIETKQIENYFKQWDKSKIIQDYMAANKITFENISSRV